MKGMSDLAIKISKLKYLRKSCVAKITSFKGFEEPKLLINGREIQEYFSDETLAETVLNTYNLAPMNAKIKVQGSGTSSQSSAVVAIISKLFLTLLSEDDSIPNDYANILREKYEILKANQEVDLRRVESKKPGMRKARRSKQRNKR